MVFFIFIGLVLLFSILSSIIKFVIDKGFGYQIKDGLKQKIPSYEQEYIERQKEIDTIDSNFFKTLAETFSKTSCSEQDYIKARLKSEYEATLDFRSYMISFFFMFRIRCFSFYYAKRV